MVMSHLRGAQGRCSAGGLPAVVVGVHEGDAGGQVQNLDPAEGEEDEAASSVEGHDLQSGEDQKVLLEHEPKKKEKERTRESRMERERKLSQLNFYEKAVRGCLLLFTEFS